MGIDSVARHAGVDLDAPGIDAALQIPHRQRGLLGQQPAAELPAAHTGMTEHHHIPFDLETALKGVHPLLSATEGQMQNVGGDGSQGQFLLFPQIHQQGRVVGLQKVLKILGREGPRLGAGVRVGHRFILKPAGIGAGMDKDVAQ